MPPDKSSLEQQLIHHETVARAWLIDHCWRGGWRNSWKGDDPQEMWQGVPVVLQQLRKRERERERVCNPFDSPHDGCWAGGEQLRWLRATQLRLSLSHLQLPDSTGIDLGQLVWGSSLLWFTRWKRDSGNLLSSYRMIAYVPEQDRSGCERPVVKALNWKQECYPVC